MRHGEQSRKRRDESRKTLWGKTIMGEAKSMKEHDQGKLQGHEVCDFGIVFKSCSGTRNCELLTLHLIANAFTKIFDDTNCCNERTVLSGN